MYIYAIAKAQLHTILTLIARACVIAITAGLKLLKILLLTFIAAGRVRFVERKTK